MYQNKNKLNQKTRNLKQYFEIHFTIKNSLPCVLSTALRARLSPVLLGNCETLI